MQVRTAFTSNRINDTPPSTAHMPWLDSFSSFHTEQPATVQQTNRKSKVSGERGEKHSVQQIIDAMFGMKKGKGGQSVDAPE